MYYDVKPYDIGICVYKSPAYGRHWISWHVRIVAPILRKRKKKLGSNQTNFLLLEFIFSGRFLGGKTLNCHISLLVRAFDLLPPLIARPKYQLLFDWRALLQFNGWSSVAVALQFNGWSLGPGNWLCDLRTNVRPKKTASDGKNTHTHRQTDSWPI